MSILGVVLGVAALIVVMGVMNGFDNELESKIIGVNPHIFIKKYSGVFNYNKAFIKKISTDYKQIDYVYPLLTTQCMISSGSISSGALLNGIDLKNSGVLHKYIKGNLNGVVLGKELMTNLGLSLNDRVRITLPFGKVTPFGFAPLSFKETITGIFNSGMYDYDTTFVYISLKELWNRTEMKNKINTIAIGLDDPYLAKKVSNSMYKKLPYGFYVSNWMDLNRNFFTALKLEKIAMFIILMLVVVVAAFNIMSSLTMLVMEKTKDISILMAFGATNRNIMNIFIKQAVAIGAIGVILGDVLGLGLSFLLKKYQFVKLPSDVYYITNIPVDVSLSYIIVISLSAFILVVLASVYPAFKASKADIVEVLRS